MVRAVSTARHAPERLPLRPHRIARKFSVEPGHANRLDRGETRQHVADMPLLEKRKRKPDEMAEQPGAKGEMERVLQDHDNQRPEPGDGDREGGDEGETERLGTEKGACHAWTRRSSQLVPKSG
jgi:hypothetical protein